MAASVRQRLLNHAKQTGQDFNFILNKYATERFLYRLAQSSHAENFVLKGATLFAVWYNQPHRPTKDIDFLGFCNADMDEIKAIFSGLCQLPMDDGILFDVDSIAVDEIREGNKYDGIRVKFGGVIEKAKVNLQIDIGFGDVVLPDPKFVKVPSLLDFPAPTLKAYSVYSVIAEKFEAMCALGEANSRMKDFYDLWYIASHETLQKELLIEALQSTFKRRGTQLVKSPNIFDKEFMEDPDRIIMWKAFLKKNNLTDMGFRDAVMGIKNMVDVAL